jgi:hypothetical protein
MVVIATPTGAPLLACNPNDSAAPAIIPVACDAQATVKAPVSSTNGIPALARTRAISISQGQCATIEWQMLDPTGMPINLTTCGFTDEDTPENKKIVLRLKEQLALGNARPVPQVDATVTAPETGTVTVTMTKQMVNTPGIYYAEMALIDTSDESSATPCVVFSNTFTLIINRSTFTTQGNDGGPPSIAEVRLHLRDSSPGESYLLEHVMFDDAEIALAIARPVMYWNEVPPPLDATYNTQNFPFRYHWLEGICANLFFMVAEQYRRNQLSYSAGGMSVDDQNKEGSYERAGQARWQAYREWVRATKASINLESCYGEVTSAYKYSAYTDALRIRY